MPASATADTSRETAARRTAASLEATGGSRRVPVAPAERTRSIRASTPRARPAPEGGACPRISSKEIPWSRFWPRATERARASRSRSSFKPRIYCSEVAGPSQDPKAAARRSASRRRATCRRICRKMCAPRRSAACLAIAQTMARTSASAASAATPDRLERRTCSARAAAARGVARRGRRFHRQPPRTSGRRRARVPTFVFPARRSAIRPTDSRAAAARSGAASAHPLACSTRAQQDALSVRATARAVRTSASPAPIWCRRQPVHARTGTDR